MVGSLVQVNGSDGIGTGWSSSIPNYNPLDLINNIRRLIKGEVSLPCTTPAATRSPQPVSALTLLLCHLPVQPAEPMHPWYRGFTGTIEPKPGTASHPTMRMMHVTDKHRLTRRGALMAGGRP